MNDDSNSRQKGNAGEQAAENYMLSLGWEIVAKNFHFGRHGEIDLIAKDGDTLVFVEVKTSSSDTYGNPLFWITAKKQNSLRRAAEGYLYINKISDTECRFDVITIEYTEGNANLSHIKNAF